MQLLRYSIDDGAIGYGLLDGQRVREIFGSVFGDFKLGTRTHALEDVQLQAPVVPSKIVCVARNYARHARELGHQPPPEPLLFLKPPSAVIGPEAPLVLPRNVGRVDFEGELAVVMRKRARHVSPSEAAGMVLGYTCLNDVTARDIQQREKTFTRAKGFDTFCPIGPWIVTGISPQGRRIQTRVNGHIRQDGNSADMIHSVWDLVAFASSIMTLEPGDVLATGTPSGVGPLHPGDRVEIEIDGIGILSHPVIEEETRGE